jgi:hypothetical protein
MLARASSVRWCERITRGSSLDPSNGPESRPWPRHRLERTLVAFERASSVQIGSNGTLRSWRLPDEFSDPRCLLGSQTPDLTQSRFIGSDNALDGAELEQQPMSQRRADTRQALKNVEPAGGEPLRFPIIAAEIWLIGPGRLFGQKEQNLQRVFRIA